MRQDGGRLGTWARALPPCTCLTWNLQTCSPCNIQVKGPIRHSSWVLFSAYTLPWLHHFLPTFLKHVNLLPGTSLLIACLLSHLSQSAMVGVRVLWTQQGWGGCFWVTKESGHPSWAEVVPSHSQTLLPVRITWGDFEFPKVQTATPPSEINLWEQEPASALFNSPQVVPAGH